MVFRDSMCDSSTITSDCKKDGVWLADDLDSVFDKTAKAQGSYHLPQPLMEKEITTIAGGCVTAVPFVYGIGDINVDCFGGS